MYKNSPQKYMRRKCIRSSKHMQTHSNIFLFTHVYLLRLRAYLYIRNFTTPLVGFHFAKLKVTLISKGIPHVHLMSSPEHMLTFGLFFCFSIVLVCSCSLSGIDHAGRSEFMAH